MTTTKNLVVTDRRKIREHWKKTDAQIALDIGIIRNWFKTQKHLPEIPSDNVIEFFLTNCKFSIEKTKQVMDMHYTVRHLLPDFYQNKHPSLEHMKLARKALFVVPMPRLTEDLHRITIMSYNNDIDPDLYCVPDVAASIFRNLFEIKTQEDLTLGEIFIIDFKYVKMGHVIKSTPMVVKKAAFILERVWANRVKEMHFINSPTYVDTVMNLARTFFSKKLRERLFVHDSMEELYKTVPRELLPCDYGGKESSLEELAELWNDKYDDYKERFDEMEQLNVKENLRPTLLENDDILGYHGNFKKIDVD